MYSVDIAPLLFLYSISLEVYIYIHFFYLLQHSIPFRILYFNIKTKR